jgi:hypothetical protein
MSTRGTKMRAGRHREVQSGRDSSGHHPCGAMAVSPFQFRLCARVIVLARQKSSELCNVPSHERGKRSADRRSGACEAPFAGQSRRPAGHSASKTRVNALSIARPCVPRRPLAQSARRGRPPLGAPPRRFVGSEPALAKPPSDAHERCSSVSHGCIRTFRS